jgi:hypothetical protein
MQLKLKRSQRQGGVMGGKLLFCLDARVELTAQEADDVRKYKLGSMCIYNSEASKKHLTAGMTSLATGNALGIGKAAFSMVMHRLNTNITIDGLVRGTHIECKDMDELLGAEESVMEACQNLRAYLDTAATFDGQEVVIDYSTGQPKLAA